MKRLFKTVSRFLRGLTGRMRAVLCLSLVLVLALGAFGIYQAVKPEETKGGTANTLLFPKVERGGIESVLLHHENGVEFTVKRYIDKIKDAEGNEVEVSGFLLADKDREYGHLSLNDAKLSELIVDAGTHYVFNTVIEAPDAADPEYAQKMALYTQKVNEFALGDDAPYYEMTTVAGEKFRVYYGVKSTTGGSYYVRLAGKDAIYITTGAFLGDLLNEDSPVSLLNASLFLSSNNEYAYAYPGLFRITDYTRYEREDFPYKRVDAAVRVGFTCMGEDGELFEASCNLDLDEHKDFKVLIGKELRVYAAGELVFDAFTPDYTDRDENGAYAGGGETVRYDVRSIDYVETNDVRVSLRFVNPSERDIANRYSIYGFTMDGTSHYLPSTDVIMTALETTSKATGSVVAIGLSPELIDKYGLYRYTVEMNVPYFGEDMYVKDAAGKDTEDLAPIAYLPGYVYVSDVTENGTRYVGSMTYGIVCEVDAASFGYLDYDFIDFVEPYMVNAAIMDVTHMWASWNFDRTEAWLRSNADFAITFGTETNYSGEAYAVIKTVTATHDKDGTQQQLAIDTDIYTQFFYRLYYIKYKGEHALSDAEVDALLADESKTVLTLGIRLSDGSEQTFRFVPISYDRVLVALEHEGKSNEKLVIYGTALRDLARAYINMMNGVPFDHEDRY